MKAKKLLINLSVFILSAFIIVYIIIQLISGLTTDVSFEYASAMTVQDTLEKTGYLVRNETVLFANETGVVNYSVSESQKMGSGQLIATVYENSQGVELQNKIREIDEKIAILERSAVDTSYLTSDVSKIDEKIYDSLVHIRSSMEENRISLTSQYLEEILVNFNKRQIITNTADHFAEQIQTLKDQKASLMSTLHDPICTVSSPASGYFSTLLDGYESNFTPADVASLTVDSFQQLIKKEPKDFGEHAVGKIITDFDWYTLCEASSAEAEGLNVGKKYPITYLYSSGQQIDATLQKKVTQTNSDSVILVFLIEEVPQDFDYTRQQTIKIVRKSVGGIAFSQSALRLIDGVQGVFVVAGNTVEFRRVDIIYSSDSLYFSREKERTDEDAKEYLSRFDRVITEGKDLYIGKILD